MPTILGTNSMLTKMKSWLCLVWSTCAQSMGVAENWLGSLRCPSRTVWRFTHIFSGKSFLFWRTRQTCNTHPFFRPILFQYGLWDQVRVDQGKEWTLMLFIQEKLAHLRCNVNRAPHLQTTSKQVPVYLHYTWCVYNAMHRVYVMLHYGMIKLTKLKSHYISSLYNLHYFKKVLQFLFCYIHIHYIYITSRRA